MQVNNISAYRLNTNPLITPEMLGADGENINGPSMIRVPGWIQNSLGNYYLYFAHHKGTYIRMAFSDTLEGPWKIYEPGVLHQRNTIFGDGPVGIKHWYTHIASPEVIVDDQNRRLIMYFHGMGPRLPGCHCSTLAFSNDGLDFKLREDAPVINDTYFRAFVWDNMQYLIARLGVLYGSDHGLRIYRKGPNPFDELNQGAQLRHAAVLLKGDKLKVFYSRIGDMPECIVMSEIELNTDWNTWKASSPVTILEPVTRYEGADLPLKPSRQGYARTRLRELRDPAIFQENGKCYLLYTIAGESGIGIAELTNV